MTDVIEDRKVAALERIATALEQIALQGVVDSSDKHLLELVGLPTAEPPLPTPPPDLPITPIMQPLPPVQAAPFQFTGPSASCPVHHVAWRTVPAGVSKRTGQAYAAVLACPERGCTQKPAS